MKVVLFCGGYGMRMRSGAADDVPKPMAMVGPRPLIWHVMRYYAHFGHTEFILCLGYRGDMVRDYFLRYNEAMTNDFMLSCGSGEVELMSRDLDNWRITFVDTGLHSNIGQRLLRVRRYLDDESTFLANYADGLSDLPLDRQIADFERRQVVGSFASVRSAQSFHLVQADAEGMVTAVGPMQNDQIYINGGFFVFRHEIFDYIEEGEEPPCVEREDGSWLVSGSANADLLGDRIGVNMPDERDYSTVAGFALSVLKQIPETGDIFKFDGYRFEVVDMDGRKIDKLLVSRPKRKKSEEEAASEAPSA